ncbi:hypothetical protein QJ856_gp0910 [Tupanvirus deep ocean]|uniref:Uncharacterized protein n=2 Tax=Tupanvirus TaxID=2094720 RepID=A0AC62A7T6_9VIRU|nr:hypothetical protein QJ856_gp0910 [Tupanvirus deep ocean]QKU33847.1 hypothetical protein [Tupanvirus deep ocean]
MTFNNSAIIILIVVAFAFYLVYSQNSQPKYYPSPAQVAQFKPQLMPPVMQQQQPMMQTQLSQQEPCPKCEIYKQKLVNQQMSSPQNPQSPQVTNVMIDHDTDPYSDPIKKQDLYSMYDHLTYPQMRLPREVLDKYNEYHEKNGTYPPFGQATQPLFDNPILNGILIKQVDENEPFSDNVPSSVPLFRVKSAKNTNRFFYYIIDQRYMSKLELKIPLDHIKINGIRYNNADFYGLPEIYDGDCIENIPIYPGAKFKVTLYKTYHFP